jgi:hypothetical protein
LFLAEKPFYCFLGDPWAKHLEVLFLGFYLLPAAFTLWAFSPFFPQGKVQPLNDWPTQCPDQCNGMDEQEVRWKVVSMTGADDDSSEIPPMATQNLWAQAY